MHHVLHVAKCACFPNLITQILPARQFFPHHQAQFIAGVEESVGLRVMRTAHKVAVEGVAQQFGIMAKRSRRHCESDVRI